MADRTVRLHRVFRAPPERVYRALIDPSALVKWLPPYGFTGTVEHLDAKVGGTYRMAFDNLATGEHESFSGEYLELVQNEKVVWSDRFEEPALEGVMRTTMTLTEVSCGTDFVAVQEGLPESIPVEMCYLGWQEALVQLGRLVEAG